MLTILFIAEDTSDQLHTMYHHLEQELAKAVNLMIWRKPGHMDYILRQLPTTPDFILLLNDLGSEMKPTIKGLSHTGIPTGLFVNDVHRFVNHRRNEIMKHNIAHLFTVTRDPFMKRYPELTEKMEWFPHFVETTLYRDYGMNKDIDLLMMGAVNDVYPLRQKIRTAYEGDARFIYHPHPGYRTFHKREAAEHLIGRSYAKELNRAKIVFTCPSVFRYPVIKYFEVLACHALLLAPTFPELEDLGFIPGYHFVAIDETNFKDKATYYLTYATERQQIAEQGYQFIRQHHATTKRTKQLLDRIKSILNA